MLWPYPSSFQNGVILYSIIVTFDVMSIYLKGVLSNVGKTHFVEKIVNFDIKLSCYYKSLVIYKSNDAELWSGDSFEDDTKKQHGDF